MQKEVDIYLENLKKWQEELTELRNILLNCELTEDFKWKHPCYTYNGKNVVLLHEFKNYCAILFHKGVLLKDEATILIQQTENVQSARQIRFTKLSEIEELKPILKKYIKEAIEVEKSGLEVKLKKTTEVETPQELTQIFKERSKFKKAFQNLTPGRQKGYLYHFSKPKQSKTKIARIEKNIERILDGYGLNDCTCGLSKRKPTCDGSHKQLENQDS
ncbi:hypothetical protein IMCC3317_08980 [Kordia antarctica]|uniref:Iron-binding zinc finger CDGSH type domain-containing protein n=1 Tax=Kordia antarctica TaxID=1218801 RepID=A0A7L4ZFW4_9FLAO|nr:DUF1801 domain-containing protein [Kordia antarctica]QHI35552.1 hypothetical protein IMCC3317_08980 [Kordia antarctica]